MAQEEENLFLRLTSRKDVASETVRPRLEWNNWIECVAAGPVVLCVVLPGKYTVLSAGSSWVWDSDVLKVAEKG